MIKLGLVCCDDRIAGLELRFHLANHTSGRVDQNGGSLMETAEMAAGGASGTAGRRAWRAWAMA